MTGYTEADFLEQDKRLGLNRKKRMDNGFALYGKNLFGKPMNSVPAGQVLKSILQHKFIEVPFSVINTRTGRWQARKKQWLKRLGIRGDRGRLEGAANANLAYRMPHFEKYGHKGKSPYLSGISMFDPVLCELMYQWFCPPRGRVLDPFCGGPISGIVASVLGYRFTGLDIRREQIEANNQQAQGLAEHARWICIDSLKATFDMPQLFDFLWTDPPYYDLEVYGGGKGDGSGHQTFDEFMEWYGKVFKRCVRQVKENRFVAVKIGEIRSKAGPYYNFVGRTVSMFERLGLHYYNEIVLMLPTGTLPIRATRYFNESRKIGRCHQTVLIFWKGDPAEIKSLFGKIKIGR